MPDSLPILFASSLLRIAKLEEEQADLVGGMAKKLQSEAVKHPIVRGLSGRSRKKRRRGRIWFVGLLVLMWFSVWFLFLFGLQVFHVECLEEWWFEVLKSGE